MAYGTSVAAVWLHGAASGVRERHWGRAMLHAARRLLVMAIVCSLGACMGAPYPRGSLEQLYPHPPRPILKTVSIDAQALHYAEMPGAASRTPLLFVHGSPGEWQSWARYLDAPALAGFGVRIAMDRPGFGGSAGVSPMLDLRAQAALLAALIPPGPPAVLIGHSLGAPLAAWIALDHPDKVCGVVSIAGSLAPEYEAPRWFNHLADTWLAHALIPDSWLRSNSEILTLQAQLRRLDQEWPRLQRPFVVIQGGKDALVDPRTADVVEARLPVALRHVVRLPKAGHLLLWEDPEPVIRAILSLPCAPVSGEPNEP